MSFPGQGYALGPNEGDALWFLNTLATIRAGGDEPSGSFTFVEFLLPPDFGPPPHIHHKEDEAWCVHRRMNCGSLRRGQSTSRS